MQEKARTKLLKKWKERYEEDLDEFKKTFDSNLRDLLEEDVFVSGTRYYELKIALKDLRPPAKIEREGGGENRRFEQY